jgi:lysophospholipase L1-like esterase
MLKRAFTPTPLLLTAFCLALCSCHAPRQNGPINGADYAAPIRVACVGDSITYGAGIKDRERNSYPAQLGALLGSDWEVRNFGVSRSTLLRQGDHPYWAQQEYKDALAFQPDVVVIKLGTNDTKPTNWVHKEAFVSDCIALIRSFQALESEPRVWVCYPVPAFPERWGISDAIIAGEVIPRIDAAAAQTGVPIIDLHAALEGKGGLFPDQIHPNAEGAGVMAETICAALTGRAITR